MKVLHLLDWSANVNIQKILRAKFITSELA